MYQFFQDIYSVYLNIDAPERFEEITKIGKNIAWYHADSIHSLVAIYSATNLNIIELDIKAAFPTICTALFGINNQFIKNMNSISDKKEKNIFISMTLTAIDTNILPLLNNICKIVVFGTIFDINKEDQQSINILELKKDGCVFSCNNNVLEKLLNVSNYESKFNSLLQKHNFVFHVDIYKKYIRAHQTTFLIKENNDIIIKGIYKHIPNKLKELISELLKYGNRDILYLKEIYNNDYFKICKENNLRGILTEYFLCFENRILNSDGKYEPLTINSEIDPMLYINLFISPIVIGNSINYI